MDNDDDVAARFARIPTGNLADAMMELGLPTGVLHNLRPASSDQPAFAGWAFPIQQDQKRKQSEPGRTRHAEVIDSLAKPGDVIVIDVNARTDVCSAGALLARRGLTRGLAGFVINGSVRDVSEIRAVGFPIHCVGASPLKSSAELDTTAVNVPVRISGTVVAPGDLIVGDDTGVVRVPRADVERVLEAALRIQAKEERAVARIAAGETVTDAMGSPAEDAS